MERCEECGFVYDEAGAASVGPAIVAAAGALAGELLGAADPRRRPRAAVWSPLEYACHLRDVLLVQRERVLLALRVDRPEFVAMGRDERVEHDAYAEQPVVDVCRQLLDVAAMFAWTLNRLSDAAWSRVGVYGYPSPAERTLRWVAVHTHHEVVHHGLDIRRSL